MGQTDCPAWPDPDLDLLLHDLRGSLATAILAVETAGRGIERQDVARTRRALDTALATLWRLARLADLLLNRKRLEAGQLPIRLAETDLNELLAAVAQEATLTLAGQNVPIDYGPPCEAPLVAADRELLQRALLGLLDSAVRSSPRGGRVRVGAVHCQGGLSISLSAQGADGAPAQPSEAQGHGLALGYCGLIAQAHRGRLTVENGAAEGCTYRLWIPAFVPQDEP